MHRFPLVLALALIVLMAACDDDPQGDEPMTITPIPSGSALPSETNQPSSPASPSVTVTPSPDLPAGVPSSYDEDVARQDVPSEALIPPGMELSNRWMTETDAREVIVVAYFKPTNDPFVQARGLVEWRRSEGAEPPWTPVFGIAHAKDEGILGFEAVIGDAGGIDMEIDPRIAE